MRKLVLAILWLLGGFNFLIAQNNKTVSKKPTIGKNSFIAEGGGAGIEFSVNFDTRFKMTRFGWGGRIGIGFVSAWDYYYDPVSMIYYGGNEISAITLPVQLNYVFGKGNSPNTFEAGAGFTYVSKKLNIMNFSDWYGIDRRTQVFGTFAFMYRRQPR